MHLADETITVFNTAYDEATGYDVYIPTVITGASWHSEIDSNVDSSGGLKAANKVTLRVPDDADTGGKEYVPAHEYTGADGAYTFANGDIVCKATITESTQPAELHRSYESFTVLGVTDNRRAKAPHIKVVGS